MAAALASVFVIASLAHAKPQVAISFCLRLWSSWNIARLALAFPPPPPPPWSRGCQTRAPPCQGAPASSPSSTTGRPTSSAHTQTRQLPGEDLAQSLENQDVLECEYSGAPQPLTPTTRW